ncbi:MAG: thioredoxin family protein [Candidatus Diapherotrites archaeon]|nr:thioredoxin family protein [Candidatus Diapherotrites archaeon]
MVLATSSYKILQKGSKAPEFSLPGTDGKTHSLTEFTGKKALLIVFMCNHCPYVVPKVSYLIELQNKYQNKGLQIVGISATDIQQVPEDSLEEMKVFAKEQGINFVYLYDETQSVPKKFGATCTPDPFLFNEKFELVYHGRIDEAHKLGHEQAQKNDLEISIQETLDGKKVSVQTHPSMGCNIKWKLGQEPEYWDRPK